MFLIDDDGKSLGKVSRDQALYLAYDKDCDLVLINPNGNPPVAKLMDYGKYIYNLTKQTAKQKAQSKIGEIKELRFSIKIDNHDLEVKTARIKKFIDRGDKAKVTIILKGREMMFQDRVNELLDKIRVGADASFEKPVERAGNRFSATLVKAKGKKDEIKNG